jgi:hypothetical protein
MRKSRRWAFVMGAGCEGRWFLQELSALKVDGEPIYKTGTRLRARPPTEDEWAIYDQECKTAEHAEEILFVYLVDLNLVAWAKRKPSLGGFSSNIL